MADRRLRRVIPPVALGAPLALACDLEGWTALPLSIPFDRF
ncbi:MAG TPA: hypothetical protein VJN63_12595 [Thermoplasmata archaeon]|nr:hypothetical protein [Thermoplasmata archaeon]